MGLTFSENINICVSDNITISDNLVMSEYVNVAVVLAISVFSSLGFSESVAKEIDINPSTFDNLVMTESVDRMISLHPNVNDQLNLTESIGEMISLHPNVNDQIIITDEANFLIDINPNVNDQLNLSDSVDVANASLGGISVFDGLIVSEVSGADIPISCMAIDQLVLSESISAQGDSLGVFVFDQGFLVDAISVEPILLGINVSDDLHFSDNVSLAIAAAADIDILVYDQLNLQDVNNQLLLLYVNVYDDALISEQISSALSDLESSVNDDLYFSDLPTSALGDLQAQVYDDLILLDQISAALADLEAGVFDSLLISDWVDNEPPEINIDRFDNLILEEMPTVSLGEISFLQISVSDNFIISEYVYGQASDLVLSLADNLILTDHPETAIDLNTLVYDALILTENINPNLIIDISTSDDLILSESVSSALDDLLISVSNNLQFQDFVIVEAGEVSIRYINVFDSLQLSDQVDALTGDLGASVYDQIQLVDFPSLSFDSFISVSDSIQISDAVSAAIGDLGISVNDGLVLSDVKYISLSDLGISVDEALVLSESTGQSIITPVRVQEINLYSPVVVGISFDSEILIALGKYSPINLTVLGSSIPSLEASLFSPIKTRLLLNFERGTEPLFINTRENLVFAESLNPNIQSDISVYDNIQIIDIATLDIAPVINISTIGTGKNYETVEAWMTAKFPNNLIASNTIEKGILTDNKEYVCAGTIVQAPSNTYSNRKNYFWLEADQGIDHLGSINNGARLVYPSIKYFAPTKVSIRVENIVFKAQTLHSNYYLMFASLRGDFLKVNRCIFYGAGYPATSCQMVGSSNPQSGHLSIFTNNMILNTVQSAYSPSTAYQLHGIYLGAASGSDVIVANNTIYLMTNADYDVNGITATFSTLPPNYGIFQNNIGVSLTPYSGRYSTVQNNYSHGTILASINIGDAWDWNTAGVTLHALPADLFNNPATYDMSLKAGSIAIGAGVDLSQYFTDNILGETRSSWNIGAF